MQPYFKPNDSVMFMKYLNNAKYYMEFGSGGSTFVAANTESVQKVYSVESDKFWHEKIRTKLINNDKVTYLYVDLLTKANTWGYPTSNCTDSQKTLYSEQVKLVDDELDLILIDGRFRVACCLKSHEAINDDAIILFDDFLNRKYYHVITDYFDIIDKTTDSHMVALKKKKSTKIPLEVIEKYELVAK